MECDRKLLRIGNNLYTLHTPLTCVKRRNDGHSIGPIASDVKHPENSTTLESERTVADCEIKIESESIPFNLEYGEESYKSNDMPTTFSFAQSTATDDALEIDHDSNMESEADANDIDFNRSFPNQYTNMPSSSVPTVYNAKCGFCGCLFRNEIELNTHMKSVHINSEHHDEQRASFQCDICMKKVEKLNKF